LRQFSPALISLHFIRMVVQEIGGTRFRPSTGMEGRGGESLLLDFLPDKRRIHKIDSSDGITKKSVKTQAGFHDKIRISGGQS
jgi:hypothetical protein